MTKVLIVDDEAGIRALLKDVLADLGYETLAVPDGEAALEAFRKDPAAIRLAVIDLVLPGKGGFEVLEELRELAPRLPAIVSTGLEENLARGAGADALKRAREQGPIELLAKPYRIDALARVAATLLGSR